MIYNSLSARNSGFIEIRNELLFFNNNYIRYVFVVAIRIGIKYNRYLFTDGTKSKNIKSIFKVEICN